MLGRQSKGYITKVDIFFITKIGSSTNVAHLHLTKVVPNKYDFN